MTYPFCESKKVTKRGYNTAETSTRMAQLSSQFASISPGVSTDEAQSGLVSIMKAWDVDVDRVSRDIMDNINTLGNNFAETNGDIITGMEKAGATLSAVGTSIQDSFALFTGAQEIMQNAEVVGTALKTLSLRIRGYDEETEELSDDVVEATGKVADLTKVASNNFAGVSLWEDAAQTRYRSLKDYLGDISKIWDEINARSQTELLEKLFGKRGASVGASILQNFDQVEKAIEEMENAAGSADREMGIIRDSIEFKINELKQTWVGFLTGAVDKEGIKGILDFLTSVSEGLTGIISNVGLLRTAIIGIAGVIGSKKLGLFNTEDDSTIFGAISKYRENKADSESYRDLIKVLKESDDPISLLANTNVDKVENYTDKVKKSIRDIQEEIKATGKTGDKVISGLEAELEDTNKEGTKLGNTFKGIGKSILNGLASAAIAAAVSYIVEGLWDLFEEISGMAEEQRRKEAVQHLSDTVSASQEAAKSAEDLTEKYSELGKKLEDVTLSASDVVETKKQLATIQNTLYETYGKEAEGIDLVNGEYNTQLKLLKELKKEKANEFLFGNEGALKSTEGSTDFQRNLDTINKKVSDDTAKFTGLKSRNLNEEFGFDVQGLLDQYDELQYDIYSYSKDDDKFGLKINLNPNLTEKEADEFLTNLYKELEDRYPGNPQVQSFLSKVGEINSGFDSSAYTSAVDNVEYTMRQMLIASEGEDNIINNLESAISRYNDALATYQATETDEAKKEFEEAKKNLEEIEKETQSVQTDVDNYWYKKFAAYGQGEGQDNTGIQAYGRIIEGITKSKSKTVSEYIRDQIPNKSFRGLISGIGNTLGFSQDVVSKALEDYDVGEDWVDGFIKEVEKESPSVQAKLYQMLTGVDMSKLGEQQMKEYLNAAQEQINEQKLQISVSGDIGADKAVDSMAKMKTAVTSLSDLWEQTVQNQLAMKKDKKYLSEDGTVKKQSDTNNMAVGSADPALLNSVEAAFADFIEKKTENGEEVHKLNDALKEFEETMVLFPNDADKAQAAIDKLITAYIDETDIIKNLDETNKQWSIDQLDAMGITNAQEVVETRLNKTNNKLIQGTKKLSVTFAQFGDELKTATKDSEGIQDIYDTLVEMYTITDEAGNAKFIPEFDPTFVVQNLDLIRQAALGDEAALESLTKKLAQQYVADIQINGANQQELDGIRDRINEWVNGVDLDQLKIDGKLNDGPLIEGLNRLVKAGKITQESMNKILAGIGVVPKITYQKVPINASNWDAYLKATNASGDAATQAYNGMKQLGYISMPVLSYEVANTGATAHYAAPSSPSSSSGSGGSNGSGNKLNEDTKETFDWIEKKIQRLDEAIARLDKTVGNTYVSWGKRNKSLVKELDKVAEEMKVHEHAYKRYLENAKNLTVQDVNVAPNEEDSGSNKQYEYDKKQWDEAVKQWKTGKYQKLVQEGKIGQNDIEQIQNKYLVETIKQYEELYQKAVQAGDAIQDDQIKLGDLNKTRFDNIQSEFDSILQGFEHVSSLIDERISRSEEHGYFVNQEYYKKQLQLEKDANDRRIKRYNALVKARDKAVDSGAIKLGSQAYVEMTADIHKVREEIEASATAQLRLNNNIRQLKWDVFDYALDRLNLITDEAEFLIDMLDQHELTDDNGYFNERGWASAGLMATEYDVYMQKSKEYAKELTDIEKQLAEEKEKNGVVDQKLIERREELLKLQQDSIKAAEQEKEAIKDLVQNAINKHLEALSKLIERYKTSLSDAKSLYEYQKSISQQTENIASLQKQLQAYAGDDSEDARATIQKLQKSLEDAEQGLKETEWDKYISETGELLDKMYEDYSETLNDRLDNIDTLMEDMIGWINQKGDLINTTINDVSKQYGYEVSKETQGILNGNGDIVSSFNTDFNNKMAETLDVVKEIKDGIYAMAYGKEVKNIVDSEGTGKISNGKWHKTKDGRWWYENNDGSYAYNETITIDGKKYKFDKNGYLKGYAIGSSNIPSNQFAWTQENGSEVIFRKTDGAMLTPLNKGDMVFTSEMSKNLWDLAKNPALANMGVTVPPSTVSRTINNDNDITIVLPNVQNYDDFKSALTKDPKFVNFVQATTLGQSLGKGKLNRGNY